MADPRPPLDLIPAFEALSTLVDATSALAGELRDDPLLGRWMAVLGCMPAADRKTLLGVLEREVARRVASEGGADGLMGFRVTHPNPNPNARIYSRGLDRLPAEELEAVEWYGRLIVALAARVPARRPQSGAA